jgi:hypothetical protein
MTQISAIAGPWPLAAQGKAISILPGAALIGLSGKLPVSSRPVPAMPRIRAMIAALAVALPVFGAALIPARLPGKPGR